MNLTRLKKDGDGSFSFAVVGDSRGAGPIFGRILDEMSRDPDILFVIHLGDTVQRADASEYHRFFKQVEIHMSKPLLVVPGNHELKGNRRLYKSVLGMCYYSFQDDDAAFLVLDCTSSKGIDPGQQRWLERKLESYRALKYRFVFMHYPFFDPKTRLFHHSLTKKAARRLLVLFKKYHVSRVFCGHIHGFFEGRWDGIPFVVSGGGGAKLMGDDPNHYFFHYLKVTVTHTSVKIRVRKVSTYCGAGAKRGEADYLPSIFFFNPESAGLSPSQMAKSALLNPRPFTVPLSWELM